MAKISYLAKLGETIGFSALPNAKTFTNDYQRGKGIVLGLREGHLVAVGLVSAGRNTMLGLLVRYRRGSPKQAIEESLKTLPTPSSSCRSIKRDGIEPKIYKYRRIFV